MAVKQGSDEWHRLRLGKFTASRFSDMMANGRAKGTLGKAAITYMWDKIAERATNRPQDQIKAKALEWGHSNEDEARRMYCAYRECVVDETDFYLHPDYPDWIGGSPDALVGSDGGLELKCPERTRIHLQYLKDWENVPNEYKWQVQGLLWITKRDWWDFASFDPRPLKSRYQLCCYRIYPDKDMHDELDARAKRIIELSQSIIENLKERGIDF